jgi:hypothetical protein
MKKVYTSIDAFYQGMKCERNPIKHDPREIESIGLMPDEHTFRRMFKNVKGGVVVAGYRCVQCGCWLDLLGSMGGIGVCNKSDFGCEFLPDKAIAALEVVKPTYRKHITRSMQSLVLPDDIVYTKYTPPLTEYEIAAKELDDFIRS